MDVATFYKTGYESLNIDQLQSGTYTSIPLKILTPEYESYTTIVSCRLAPRCYVNKTVK